MTNILFFGTYQHKVDSKGRVSIPAEWRKLLDKYIYQYTNNFLIYKSIDDVIATGPEDIFLPHVIKHTIDNEGRALFKTEKSKSAILTGHGEYFKIEFRDHE